MKKTEKSNTNEIIEIPAEEAPYALPDGWKWVRVKHLCKLYRGVSYKKDDAHSEKLANDVLILRGGNIGEGYINVNTDNVYIDRSLIDETQLVRKNDIVIVGSTGSKTVIGRAGVSYCDYEDVAFGAFLILVRPSITDCYPKYLDYFFQSDNYRHRIRTLASGVNINNIRAEHINETVVPLPPLETQKRIVDRIESLFAKLDEAKEKAQTALDTFELRKSAILHKAFTGELTAQWRSSCRPSDISSAPAHIESAPADISSSAPAEHIDKPLPKEWKITTLAEIGLEFKYGVSEKSDYLFQGLPVLRIPNIGNGKLDFNDIKYLQSVEVNEEDLIHQNDILIIRSNGSRDLVGKCAIVPILTKKYAYASFLIRIKPSEKVLSAFLATYLNSNNARSQMFAKAKSSSGIHNINSKELGAIIIPLPPLPEQQEIVRILDDLLTKENAAKEAAEAVIEKIDLMKKSILARAFRGEL